MSILPGNSNLQISSLSEELARKSDDASRQQEEITHLLSQIVDLQKKAKLVLRHPISSLIFSEISCSCVLLRPVEKNPSDTVFFLTGVLFFSGARSTLSRTRS